MDGIRYILRPDVLRRNCLLAIIVGCLLTAANQLDVLLTGPFTYRLAIKILANFLIPLVVSSISALINRS